MKHVYLSFLIPVVALVSCGGGGGGGNSESAAATRVVPTGCTKTESTGFRAGNSDLYVTKMSFSQNSDTQSQTGEFTATYKIGEKGTEIATEGTWYTNSANNSAIVITWAKGTPVIEANQPGTLEIYEAMLKMRSVQHGPDGIPTSAVCDFTDGKIQIGSGTDVNTYPLSGAEVTFTYTK